VGREHEFMERRFYAGGEKGIDREEIGGKY
jgi:hypothetical protein